MLDSLIFVPLGLHVFALAVCCTALGYFRSNSARNHGVVHPPRLTRGSRTGPQRANNDIQSSRRQKKRARMRNRFNGAPAASSNGHLQADLLAITMATKRAFQRSLGGVITINTQTQKCLAIEFYGPRGNSVEIEFVQSPNLDEAEIFLRGEQYEVLRLQPDVFEAFRHVLVQNSRSKGLTDVASDCAIYEGILP